MPNKDTDNPDFFDSSSEEISQSDMRTDNLEDELLTYDLAGLNSRALAFFIDLVIIAIIAFVAYGAALYFLKDANLDSYELKRVFMPIYMLLFFLASSYFVVLNGYGGRTIGKMIMGIRIISEQGGSIGFWQSFVRWIGYYISTTFLFLGFAWSIFDANSQSWHDKIAGTYVIKE